MKNNKNKPYFTNRWLGLSAYGLQLGLSMYIFASVGKYLDEYFGFERPWLAIGLSLAAMVSSIYALLRYLKKLEDYEKEK